MGPPPGIPERRRSGAATEALARTDRLAGAIKTVTILFALYVAIAVTIASVIGVLNALHASAHAAQGARYAEAALAQARENGDLVGFLKDCLTPGPVAPNAERTGTGHVCYDTLEGNRADAVRRIIEALRADTQRS